jgi:hypothetical protein
LQYQKRYDGGKRKVIIRFESGCGYKKNSNVSCNGTNTLQIRTLNGTYTFDNQRYIGSSGSISSFLTTGESRGVRELIAYYAPKLSYRETAILLERVTGKKLYISSHLPKKVAQESALVATYLSCDTCQLSFNFVKDTPLYDSVAEEILYFDDAVGVKRQQEVRRVPWADGYKSSATVQTDTIVIGTEATGYIYLSSAEADALGVSVEDLVHIRLSQRYGSSVLPLVAITDGARTIRLRLWALFGLGVTIILDWYHLQKKVWECLSQLGLPKDIKQTHGKELCHYLWKGQVGEALTYTDVRVSIETKKQDKLQELQTYLQKHQAEICNYGKRQAAGKIIGSGKGEKVNDQLVANRQKKKAMSWSEDGSNALTILQTLQINQKWENYWANAA